MVTFILHNDFWFKEKHTKRSHFRSQENRVREIRRFKELYIALQGTVWYSKFKWPVVSNLTNHLGLTASCLGNHEFDDGLEDLEKYIDTVPFDVITCNVDFSGQSQYLNDKIIPFKIYTRAFQGQERKIGVLGYVTPDTKKLSAGGINVDFEDEVSALSKYSRQLKDLGVDIVIAVGHSGFEKDLQIAKEVNTVV